MLAPHPNECELLERSRRGDSFAFGALVEHYQDAIFNLALRMTGNREDAGDVAQNVFLNAFRKVASFEGRASLATWLYKIAVNQSMSVHRKSAKREHLSVTGDDDDRATDFPGDAPAPDQRLEQADELRLVERALAELDAEHRAVVLLRDMEGLDYSAIAEAADCSVGTVKSRLHRARFELREKIKRAMARGGQR